MTFDRKKKIKENCYIKGWFQDERYFKAIRPILLKEFVCQRKIKISEELRYILENRECVSLHIRRGDYVKLGYCLNYVYYIRAINYMKKRYENPIFVIFSDDLNWVKENIDINGEKIYVNENGQLQDYEELLIMSRCKSNIISNSTFSWWGAWLNQNQNKIVVAPKKWLDLQKNILPNECVVL